MSTPKIIYTITDEAPQLATYSLLPVIQAFARPAGVKVETRDISLAGRIIAQFPERMSDVQRQADDLSELGELAKTPEANIIKLPNISASVPQLKEAIAELKAKGYDLPDYPEEPKTDGEREVQARYARALGSSVNPVLREGNSDRRVAKAVKQYAQKNPHRLRAWKEGSRTHVAHMSEGDFYGSEQSVIMAAADTVSIEFESAGETRVMKSGLALQKGEVIDASVMSRRHLTAFFAKQIDEAKEQDMLLSLHLKATMMKVSDPIMFGYCVKEYYKDVFEKHGDTFASLGVNANFGLGDVYKRLGSLSDEARAEIEADIQAVYGSRPKLAMVDSDKGITNLHVPNDIIIDASMPPMIRDGGMMWGPDGELADTTAMIPDRCYATMYQAMVEDCQKNGAYDVATMGNVSNVGLMAQKAEEYGSHDKTFLIPADGVMRVKNAAGDTLMEHKVEEGDIWRMCQAKDAPIRDWVRLAVSRSRATGAPAIFWLDEKRAHDANLIKKVHQYLPDHDTSGLDIRILPPVEAIKVSMERARKGEDTISVTGNVLRDYLTDLFPILELGTSAKMLSIVPLLAGGGLYETGAGGSAPKHVQQFQKEGHLRWDSLGEFLAMAVSLEDMGAKTGDARTVLLGETLGAAISRVLDNRKSPSRKVNEIDNRGSHFWLSAYWAEALANQDKDAELKQLFVGPAAELAAKADVIEAELLAAQGAPGEMGGYYKPDDALTTASMRPSKTWNAIIDSIGV
jgi:isocitrate dehydrogenase